MDSLHRAHKKRRLKTETSKKSIEIHKSDF